MNNKIKQIQDLLKTNNFVMWHNGYLSEVRRVNSVSDNGAISLQTTYGDEESFDLQMLGGEVFVMEIGKNINI
jgi:hypothetical protein